MAEYLIQDTTLTEIADAIRTKAGTTDVIAVSDMAATIDTIQVGSGGFDDEYSKYLAYTVDSDERVITVFGINYQKLYADTGSYDVTIPNEINGYSIRIVSTQPS